MSRVKRFCDNLKLPLKLSTVSLLVTIFITQSSSKCGSNRFGLPLRFIRSHCDCAEHVIPIDFIYLGIDILYHVIIWYVLIYLWQDVQETWHMIRSSNN